MQEPSEIVKDSQKQPSRRLYLLRRYLIPSVLVFVLIAVYVQRQPKRESKTGNCGVIRLQQV